MKFINSLITIVVASSTLAYSIPVIKREEIDNALANFDKNSGTTDGKISSFDGQKVNAFNTATNSNGNGQNSNGNGQNLNGNISEECKNIMNQYSLCFEKLTEQNYDKVCDTYNSPQCQNTIKKKLEENDACKNTKNISQYQNSIDTRIVSMNLSCGKSESGKYCPIAEFAKSSNSTELTDEIINETCKSKACRDNAVQSFTMYQKLNELYLAQQKNTKRRLIEYDRIASALTLLNKDQCSKQAKQSSDAYSISFRNSLFLTIGLFFLLLF